MTGRSRDSLQDADDGYPLMLIEDHGQDMRQAADGIDLEFFRSTAVE